LKKKRNSRGIFQKKSSREILKRCSRQSLQYNNTDRKYRKPSKSDTSKIPIPKKLLVTPWYTTLVKTMKLMILEKLMVIHTFLQPTRSKCHETDDSRKTHGNSHPAHSQRVFPQLAFAGNLEVKEWST
jgi:hypothetical protein